MHESCVESGLEGGDAASGAASASAPGAGAGGGGGREHGAGVNRNASSAATPKEYVSFLRSWFDMHESKKVILSVCHVVQGPYSETSFTFGGFVTVEPGGCRTYTRSTRNIVSTSNEYRVVMCHLSFHLVLVEKTKR